MKSEKEIQNMLKLWNTILDDEHNSEEQIWLMRTVVHVLEWVLER